MKSVTTGHHSSSHTTLSTFIPTILTSSSSLCLSLSLAITSFVYLRGVNSEEYSEAGILFHGAATLVMRWAMCSALASAAGVVGTLQGQRSLLRFFAVATAFDLLCTLVLLLVLLLLTYAPTLSQPFSTFLCGAITGGAPSDGLNLWGGLEVCEDNWKVGMGIISAGAAVAIAGRAWGTATVWQHYGAVSRLQQQTEAASSSARGRPRLAEESDEWFDVASMRKEEQQHRMREMEELQSQSRGKRSNTLPILLGQQRERPLPRHHGRYKSHSISGVGSHNPHRPQLVLVPVFVDDHLQGPPSAPPSYYSSRSSSSSPQRSNTTSSSSSSASSFSSSSSYASPRSTYSALSPTETSFTFTAEPHSFSPSSDDDTSYPCKRGRSRSENSSKVDYAAIEENALGLAFDFSSSKRY